VEAGGQGLLKHYNGSHITALIQLYPELPLKKEYFTWVKEVAVASTSSKEEPAVSLRPKIKDQPTNLKSNKGKQQQHSQQQTTTGFENSKSAYKWNDWQSRRAFFDKFAFYKKFDPLIAENWYHILQRDIIKAGGRGVLGHYQSSHIKALIDTYPEVNLIQDKFPFYRRENRGKKAGREKTKVFK